MLLGKCTMYGAVVVTLSGSVLRSNEPTLAARSDVISKEVAEAFVDAATGPEGRSRAQTKLEQLPREQAVYAIVEVIGAGEGSMCAEVREMAYSVLSRLNAAQLKLGRDQFILGLRDSYRKIRRISCDALGSEGIQEEVSRVQSRLRDRTVCDREKEAILEAIEGWGPCGSATVGAAAELLQDTQVGQRLRDLAASAVLGIGGLEVALESFGDLDSRGQGSGLFALAGYFSRLDEDRLGNIPEGELGTRRRAEAFALNAIRNVDVLEREAPLSAVALIFGDDIVVGSPDDGFRIHPDFEVAYRSVARNHPDVSRREKSDQIVNEQLERIKAKVLRQRERRRAQ